MHDETPVSENVPPAHVSQVAAPAVEYLPASQGVHEEDELPLYVPASQVEQSTARPSENSPPSQAVHVVALYSTPV